MTDIAELAQYLRTEMEDTCACTEGKGLVAPRHHNDACPYKWRAFLTIQRATLHQKEMREEILP